MVSNQTLGQCFFCVRCESMCNKSIPKTTMKRKWIRIKNEKLEWETMSIVFNIFKTKIMSNTIDQFSIETWKSTWNMVCPAHSFPPPPLHIFCVFLFLYFFFLCWSDGHNHLILAEKEIFHSIHFTVVVFLFSHLVVIRCSVEETA